MVRDYFYERAVVVHGTRRYVVHKPTCETVAKFTALYSLEIQALVNTWKQANGLGSDPVAVCLVAFLPDLERVASVASTCVELVGGAPGEMEEIVAQDRDLARKLFLAALTTCDPERIVSLTSILEEPDLFQAKPKRLKVTSFEVMISILAERYGVTPFDVMRWPYEAACSLFGEVIPAIGDLMSGRTPRGDDDQEQPGVSPFVLGGAGIGYARTN